MGGMVCSACYAKHLRAQRVQMNIEYNLFVPGIQYMYATQTIFFSLQWYTLFGYS